MSDSEISSENTDSDAGSDNESQASQDAKTQESSKAVPKLFSFKVELPEFPFDSVADSRVSGSTGLTLIQRLSVELNTITENIDTLYRDSHLRAPAVPYVSSLARYATPECTCGLPKPMKRELPPTYRKTLSAKQDLFFVEHY